MAPVYLRLSVTEQCNLRCVYCMPQQQHPPRRAELADGEILALVERIGQIAALKKIRVTGGEPLVRPGLIGLIASLRRALPAAEICLTTNGLLLPRLALPLKRAGLDALNMSLDTTDAARFRELTGGGRLPGVMRGLAAARAAGFDGVKLNAVMQRTYNADQLVELVLVASRHGCEIRFIELMPFGAAARRHAMEYVSADEALARICEQLTYVGSLGRRGTATRHLLRSGGRDVKVGFITAMSHPFCGDCNRIRLDSRGHLYSCLRQEEGVDLSGALRRGDSPELASRVRAVIDSKCPADTAWPGRSMSAIGG